MWSVIICGLSSKRRVNIHRYIMPIVHVCRHHTCMPVILAQYIRALDLVPSLQIISANCSNISSLISPSLGTESTTPGGLSKKLTDNRCNQASFLAQEYLFLGNILCKQVGLSHPVNQKSGSFRRTKTREIGHQLSLF